MLSFYINNGVFPNGKSSNLSLDLLFTFGLQVIILHKGGGYDQLCWRHHSLLPVNWCIHSFNNIENKAPHVSDWFLNAYLKADADK